MEATHMQRLQRIRSSQLLRDLTADTHLSRAQLIQPLFAVEGITADEPVPGLRGVNRSSIENLLRQTEADLQAGVTQFILFTVPSERRDGKFSADFAQKAISSMRESFGSSMALWVDTCLCSYTTHGHCCVFDKGGRADLEETQNELATLAKAYIEAGADGVAPSDMQDGRVGAIRAMLDAAGRDLAPIMSYSTKFASSFYGPFRVAADSAPKFGDRKQYQLDFRNRNEAIASSLRCAEEGADLLMVKPALLSLDLIAPIHEAAGRPVGAYQVSGEFASLHYLAEAGMCRFENALLETLYSIRRAGARYIITYAARMAKELGI